MSVISQKMKDLAQQMKKFCQKLFSRKKKDGKKISVPKIILKTILWILGIFLSLILLILIFLDPILHFSVTKIGSMVTGLEISAGNVELSLLHGNFKITNLKVSNPEGFDQAVMLDLGTLYIAWDNDTIFTDEIIVKNLEIRNLNINAHVNESGKLNFLAVLEKFADPSGDSPETAPAPATVPTAAPDENAAVAQQKKLWIEQFSIANFRFNWIDKRKQLNIHGFGVDIGEISGSMTGGSLQIKSFKISNPETYAISDLLSVESISVTFEPQTIYTPSPIVNDVTVSGMTACAEFNKAGDFNILEIIDSLQEIFPAENDESAEDPDIATETENPTAADEAETDGVKLQVFTLKESWFHLEDDRIRIPIKMPLYYSNTNYSFFESTDMDIEILPFLHKYAVLLRDTCSGVTDADQLTLNFMKSAAELGFSVFTKAGGIIIDGGEILINSGGKLIDGTKDSGKKVVDGIVNMFK